MSELQRLTDLAQAVCQHPPGSRERKRALNQLIREIQKSGKLWHDYRDPDIYDEALQITWEYFCKNLCEATTTKPFDPQESSITTWFNKHLKWRLYDLHTKKTTDWQQRKWSQVVFDPENPIDPMMNIPDSRHDVPPILEVIQAWLEADTEPRLDAIHVKGRPEITARLLIQRHLPPEVSWKEVGEEVDYPPQLLASFYHRRCLPLLREFGKAEGFFGE